MAVQNQRDASSDNPDVTDGQRHAAGVEAQNSVDATTVSSLVQAHTIIGGVHLHDQPVPPRPVPRQLPPAPHGFVGRTDHLAELDRRATPTDISATRPHQTTMVVISTIGGTGGIGKTWLALTWAHRNLDRFPDGQLFVDLHGFSTNGRPAQPADVLGGLLEALGVDRDHQPDDTDRRTDLYRSLIADKRMLVILDNAASTDQVTPLLPGSHLCTVLITSRKHLHGLVARHGARPIHLDVLTTVEAHALLATALGPDQVAAAGPAVAEIVKLCGWFPLALGLIAARAAAAPHLPLRDTVDELRALGLDALDSEDPTASLPTVLSWSLRHLTNQHRQVFTLLGIAPGPDIALPAASRLTGMPERETHSVLRALADTYLIDRVPGGRYAMHDLIRAYATSIDDDLPNDAHESALRRLLEYYTNTAHDAQRLLRPPKRRDWIDPPVSNRPQSLPDVAAAWAWFDTEHACLLAAQHTATVHGWHSTVWALAFYLETFHIRRGHIHDWLAVWQAAADAAHHLSDSNLAYAHRCLGRGHADLGHHEDAITHLHHALTLAERDHDPAQRAHTHYALAWVWGQLKDARQALEHAHQSLALFRVLDHPVWAANALNAVGWHAAHLGDYDTARANCQAALKLHRDHHALTGEAATLDSLGYIDHRSGHHHRAIGHYRHALTLYDDVGDTYEAANTLDKLGHPYTALGQVDHARTTWAEALRLYREQRRHDEAARVQQQLDELDINARPS